MNRPKLLSAYCYITSADSGDNRVRVKRYKCHKSFKKNLKPAQEALAKQNQIAQNAPFTRQLNPR
jgi:hypothetical protein